MKFNGFYCVGSGSFLSWDSPTVGILFFTVADTYDATHEIASVIEKNEEKNKKHIL